MVWMIRAIWAWSRASPSTTMWSRSWLSLMLASGKVDRSLPWIRVRSATTWISKV